MDYKQIAAIIRRTPNVNCFGRNGKASLIARPIDVVEYYRDKQHWLLERDYSDTIDFLFCGVAIRTISTAIEEIGGGVGYLPLGKFIGKVALRKAQCTD